MLMLMFWDVDPNISAFQVSSSFFSKLLSTCPRHAPASSSPSHQDLGTFHKKHCFKIINSIIIIETMPTIIIIDFITISIINHLSTISIPTAIININISIINKSSALSATSRPSQWPQSPCPPPPFLGPPRPRRCPPRTEQNLMFDIFILFDSCYPQCIDILDVLDHNMMKKT